MSTRLLWHLTPLSSLPGIARNGLQPSEARTKSRCVWLMPIQSLAARQAHVARSQRVIVPHLVRLQVVAYTHLLTRYRTWSFRYWSEIPPGDIRQALMMDEAGRWRDCPLWPGLVRYARHCELGQLVRQVSPPEVDFWEEMGVSR